MTNETTTPSVTVDVDVVEAVGGKRAERVSTRPIIVTTEFWTFLAFDGLNTTTSPDAPAIVMIDRADLAAYADQVTGWRRGWIEAQLADGAL